MTRHQRFNAALLVVAAALNAYAVMTGAFSGLNLVSVALMALSGCMLRLSLRANGR